MKKYLLKVLLVSIFALPFISCDSDDDDIIYVEPEIKTTGIYLLNSGIMGSIDGTLSYYDVDTKKVTENIFSKQNDDLSLGDIAQDIVIYGSKMYITATNSNKIYITDRKAKLVPQRDSIISPENESKQPLKPRSIVTHKGKVYVSTEAGYILRIDTTTMNMDRVKAGTFTEEMTVVNDKLYVTNSRTGNKTVSILDLNNFSAQKTEITVDDNPAAITSDKSGNIFVIPLGIWGSTSSTLYKINATNNQATKIGEDVASMMAINGDKLLLVKVDYNTNPASTTLSYYDIKKGELVNKSFITDGTTISAPGNSIKVDPATGYIYLGTGDYQNKGKMYVFSAEGKLIDQFATGGYYPMGAYFLTGTK
ncbi:YncE family protein [Dysgonomonas sp. BGC7]|uniref:YncE family protein n=1 Tax=Dysgonomonas sp. BGC7 TaxID=1658008 RepID=UPI00068221DA|nr:DUF5074 domain-containing protein [Dysgonomonas sp. BGC7]MBD8390208.1 hypothetical protein [Dysgonomonas sp. BGC7]